MKEGVEVKKMIKIGLLLFCISIVLFAFYNRVTEAKELVLFEEKLKETGLIGEIGKRLYENGYLFSLTWEALSKKNVDIVINLPKKEINEDNKNEVKQIINDLLLESNVNPKLFTIGITNYRKEDNICKPE